MDTETNPPFSGTLLIPDIKSRALLWLSDELKMWADLGYETLHVDKVLELIGQFVRFLKGTAVDLTKNLRTVYEQALSRERHEGVEPTPFLLKGIQRTVEIDLHQLILMA